MKFVMIRALFPGETIGIQELLDEGSKGVPKPPSLKPCNTPSYNQQVESRSYDDPLVKPNGNGPLFGT